SGTTRNTWRLWRGIASSCKRTAKLSCDLTTNERAPSDQQEARRPAAPGPEVARLEAASSAAVVWLKNLRPLSGAPDFFSMCYRSRRPNRGVCSWDDLQEARPTA